MVGWHHRLNGHESERTPGAGEGQGSLAYCSPWGHKELDTTEWLNNNNGNNSLFNFLRSIKLLFTAAASFTFPATMHKGFHFSTFLAILVIFHFFFYKRYILFKLRCFKILRYTIILWTTRKGKFLSNQNTMLYIFSFFILSVLVEVYQFSIFQRISFYRFSLLFSVSLIQALTFVIFLPSGFFWFILFFFSHVS